MTDNKGIGCVVLLGLAILGARWVHERMIEIPPPDHPTIFLSGVERTALGAIYWVEHGEVHPRDLKDEKRIEEFDLASPRLLPWINRGLASGRFVRFVPGERLEVIEANRIVVLHRSMDGRENHIGFSKVRFLDRPKEAPAWIDNNALHPE